MPSAAPLPICVVAGLCLLLLVATVPYYRRTRVATDAIVGVASSAAARVDATFVAMGAACGTILNATIAASGAACGIVLNATIALFGVMLTLCCSPPEWLSVPLTIGLWWFASRRPYQSVWRVQLVILFAFVVDPVYAVNHSSAPLPPCGYRILRGHASSILTALALYVASLEVTEMRVLPATQPDEKRRVARAVGRRGWSSAARMAVAHTLMRRMKERGE
jgi:hypothetical protein